MDITEIIKKVKANLKTQEELRVQLENQESVKAMTEDQIGFKQNRLKESQNNESQVWEEIVNGLQESTELIKDNLSVFMAYAYDEGCELGFFAEFMGKKYSIFANDYTLSTKENPRDVEVKDFADNMFKDYMSKGKVIFNEETLNTLLEIKKLYEIKPEVVTEKLVGLDVERKNIKLLNELGYYKEELAKSVAELKEVEEKIAKTKEFKSEFLKKIFTKKARLQEKREGILHNNSKMNQTIKDLEQKINDRSAVRDESDEYVKNELNALKNIFDWVDCFEKSKNALIRYRLENITVLSQKIQGLKEKLANTNTRIKELKGMLQLNKKVNNETVINALMNQELIDQLNVLNISEVAKGDVKAVQFIEKKYHEHLQGKVETLVK